MHAKAIVASRLLYWAVNSPSDCLTPLSVRLQPQRNKGLGTVGLIQGFMGTNYFSLIFFVFIPCLY